MTNKQQEFLTAIYNSSFEYFNHVLNSQKSFIDEAMSKHEKEKKRARIHMFMPWGIWYHSFKALWNTGVSLVQGISTFVINLAQNSKNAWESFKEIDIKHGKEAFKQSFNEFGEDVMNMVAKGFEDSFKSLVTAGGTLVSNVGVMFGAETDWAEPFLQAVDNLHLPAFGEQERLQQQKGGYTLESREKKEIKHEVEEWAEKSIIEVNNALSKAKIKNDWFARTLWDDNVYQIYSGIIDGVVGMLPVMAMNFYGVPFSHVVAGAYFAATTYGNSVEEALNRGASVEDALSYGTGMAVRQAITQTIFGTLSFGSGQPSANLGIHILQRTLKYAGRSVVTSLMNSPIQYDEEGNRIYETRQELLTRTAFQAMIGSGVGAVLGLLEYGMFWGKVKERYGVKPKHGQAFLDMEELLRQEWSKMTPEERQEFQKTFKQGLDDVLNNLNEAQKEGGVLNDDMANTLMSKLDKTILGMMIERTKGGEFVLNFRGEQLYENLSPATNRGNPLNENGVYRLSLGARVLEEYIDKDGQVVKVNVLDKSSPKYQEHSFQINKALRFAELLGVDVVFFETGDEISLAEKGSLIIIPDGQQTQGGVFFGGISYINIDAIQNDVLGLSVNALVGHEIFHDIQRMVIENKLSLKDRETMTELMTASLYLMVQDAERMGHTFNFFADNEDGTMRTISFEEAKSTNDWSQVKIYRPDKTIVINFNDLFGNIALGEVFAYFVQSFFNMDNIVDSFIAQRPELSNKLLTFFEERRAEIFKEKYETKGLTPEEQQDLKELMAFVKTRQIAEQRYYSLLKSLQESYRDNIWGHIFRSQSIYMPLQFSNEIFDDDFFKIFEANEQDKISLKDTYLVRHEQGKMMSPFENGVIIDHSQYYNSNFVITFKDNLRNQNFVAVEDALRNVDKIKLTHETPSLKPYIGYSVSEFFGYQFALEKIEAKEKKEQTYKIDPEHLSTSYIGFLEDEVVKETLKNMDKYFTTRIKQEVQKTFKTDTKFKKVSKDLYEVDADTYFNFYVLNYPLIRKENYVSFYPKSEYRHVQGKFFLREDGRAGFWVAGDEPTNDTFSANELGGIFNSDQNKRGFLRAIKPTAIKSGAKVMYTISAKLALIFHKIFGKDLRIASNKIETAQLYGEYNNQFLIMDWGLDMNNAYGIMLRKAKDTATYNTVDSASSRGIEKGVEETKAGWVNGFSEDKIADGAQEVLIQTYSHIHSSLKDPLGRPLVWFLTDNLFITNKNNLYYSYMQGRDAKGFYVESPIPVIMDITKLVGNHTKINIKDAADIISDLKDTNLQGSLNRVLLSNKKVFDKKGEGYLKNILFKLIKKIKTDEQMQEFLKAVGKNLDAEAYLIDNNNEFSILPFYRNLIKPYTDLNNPKTDKPLSIIDDYMNKKISDKEKNARADFNPRTIRNFKAFEREASFVPLVITDKSTPAEKEMFARGYILKHALFDYYFHKDAFFVSPEIQTIGIKFNTEVGYQKVTLKLKRISTGEVFELPIFPDYLDTKTNTIIVNSQLVAFGSSIRSFASMLKTGKSIEQSISIESAINDVFSCELFTGIGEKPKIITVLNSNGINKARFLTDVDLFTPQRFTRGKYIMFVNIVDDSTEPLYKKALAEIKKNDGIISKEIQNNYRIYLKNDPNIQEYSRLETQKNIEEFTISMLYEKLFELKISTAQKINTLNILKGYFLSKYKGQEYTVDALSDAEFLRNLDKQFEKILAIFNSKEVNKDVAKLLKILGKSRYKDIRNFVYRMPFVERAVVREGKTDVDLSKDVAAFIFEGLDDKNEKVLKMLEIIKNKYPNIETNINSGSSMVAFNTLVTPKIQMFMQGEDPQQIITKQEETMPIENQEHQFLMEEINSLPPPEKSPSLPAGGGAGGQGKKHEPTFDYWEHFRKSAVTVFNQETRGQIATKYIEAEREIKDINISKEEPLSEVLHNLVKIINNHQKEKMSKQSLYNHMGITILKFTTTFLHDQYRRGTTELSAAMKELFLKGLIQAIMNERKYVDTVFSGTNITDVGKDKNPEGYQYTTGMDWLIRELEKQEKKDYDNDFRGGVDFKNFVSALYDVNFLDIKNLATLQDALIKLINVFVVERVSIYNPDGSEARTMNTVITKMLARLTLENKVLGSFGGDKKRTGGIFNWSAKTGRYRLFLNPENFLKVASVIEGTGLEEQISRIWPEATRKFLQVQQHEEAFNKEFYRKNKKSIRNLRKNINIYTNAKYKDGTNAEIDDMTALTLLQTIIRDTLINHLILTERMEGEVRRHIESGQDIVIENKKGKEIVISVINDLDLFKELYDKVIKDNSFASKFLQHTLEYFNSTYGYTNEVVKRLYGVELDNESLKWKKFATENEEEANAVLDTLHENLKNNKELLEFIYIPITIDDKGTKIGKFDVNKIETGVYRGMTEEVTGTTSRVLIKRLDIHARIYSHKVANYYAYYREFLDLKDLWNSPVIFNGQHTTIVQILKDRDPAFVDYIENLADDMVGVPRTGRGEASKIVNKILRQFRKAFHLQAIGFSLTTGFSQFSTWFNMVAFNYRKGYGAKGLFYFIKAFFWRGDEIFKNNEFIKHRYSTGTLTTADYETPLGQIPTLHIKHLDKHVSKSLYLLYINSTNPETGKKFTPEEAIAIVEKSIYQHQSTPLAYGRTEITRSGSELLKFTTHFMNEIFQKLSNIIQSFLRVVKTIQLNKHKDEILEEVTGTKKEYAEELLKLREQVEKDVDFQASDAYKQMSEVARKDFDKKARETETEFFKKAEGEEEFYKSCDKFAEDVKQGSEDIKGSFRNFAGVVAGWFGALLWLTTVSTAFGLMRGKWREKEDDEEMYAFILKFYGKNFMDRFFSYIPFVRDVYNLLINQYSFNTVPEFDNLNAFINETGKFFRDVAEGKEINYLKTFRVFGTHLGHMFGIPVRNIERLITTPLNLFTNKGTFLYKNATGQRLDYQKEMSLAIKNNDDEHLYAIIDARLNERNIHIGTDVFDELVRLTKESGEIISIVGNYGRFTIKGETYEMTDKEKDAFTAIYNQADDMASRVIRSSEYKQLNDKYKAKLLQSIFNYYYRMAKQKITGHQFIAEKSYFENSADAYDYFISVIANLLYKRQEKEYENKFS